MRIVILSQNGRTYTTRRLRDAASNRGHRVRIIDPLRVSLYLEQGTPKAGYHARMLSKIDAIIPRIGPAITFFGTAVVRQFEQMGIYSVNSSFAINASRDKLRCLQILSSHGIPIPHSAFVRERGDILAAIEEVGGVPVVIKLLEGSQGIGVILAESLKQAETIVETLLCTRQNILIQKFIEESRGRDIRAFVVGDRVVAAMRRSAHGDEFRSNVHRGAVTEAIHVSEEYERVAVRTAQILGVRVAGVDILESHDGPKIMEVNSSPGMEGIEATTGADIAGAVIRYIEEQAQFPEIDLRQRLPHGGDFSIVEIKVPEGSSWSGMPVAESELATRDVLLLSIQRNGSVRANPAKSERIESGDTLLCYGNSSVLRDLLEKLAASGPRRRKSSRKNG